MGELMLCNQMPAAMPYFMDEMSIHVYSLEELSYFIEKNTCLLTSSFMCTELTDWIGYELGLKELAQSLQKIREEEASLAEFVEYLLLQVGYCTKETCKKIAENLRELELRPPYEAIKMRADWYMEKKRYINGLYEYQKLTKMDEVQAQPVFEGSVWHNLGTAYARLLLFDEAAECYENAYRLNQDEQSLLAGRYAKMLCWNDGNSEEDTEFLEKLRMVESSGSVMGFYQSIEDIFARPNSAEVRREAVKILEDWKAEYRKNCKL